MELNKSVLKEKDPIFVAFLGNLKCSKEMSEYKLKNFEARDQRTPVSTIAVICNFNWYIYDKEKIQQIMNFFSPICDDETSFQSLWRSCDIDYISLFLDFNLKNKDIFDNVVDNICKILEISVEDNCKNYISSIEVAYPETWL